MNTHECHLSDETIQQLAREIVAHQRVGNVQHNGDSRVVGNSRENSGLVDEDNASGFHGLKFGDKLGSTLVRGADLSSARVDDSHNTSPSVAGSDADTSDAVKSTVGDAAGTIESPSGVSAAPSGGVS